MTVKVFARNQTATLQSVEAARGGDWLTWALDAALHELREEAAYRGVDIDDSTVMVAVRVEAMGEEEP